MAPSKTPTPQADSPAESTSTSERLFQITYHDGRDADVVVADSPAVVFKLSRLGITDDLQEGFVAIWLAAGAPGTNGAKLTQVKALDLTERWLENDVAKLTDVSGPPTSRRRAPK